jgi:hypothetical protein
VHHCVAFVALGGDCAALVSHAIDAFGARAWLEGDAIEAGVEPWLPACVLCRFLIVLLSDFVAPDRYDITDLVRPSVLHALASSPLTVADAANMFAADHRRLVLDALHELGEPCTVDGAAAFRLKAAHEDLFTPFWLFVRMPDFLGFVARAANAKRPHLLAVPPVGAAAAALAGSAPLLDFIARAAALLATQTAAPAHFALMALVQMVAAAARAPAEALVAAGVFESLAAVPALREPLVALMAHAKAAAPSAASRLDALYASLPAPAIAAVHRTDRARILGRFAAARDAFQRSIGPDEESPDTDAPLCVSCREPIDRATQLPALGWSGAAPALCPHFMHTECAARLQAPVCPVCRRLTVAVTPVLRPECTAAQRIAGAAALGKLLDRGGLPTALELAAQLLDVGGAAALPPPFEVVLRSIVIASGACERRGECPLVAFAARLSTAAADADFERFVAEVWPGGDAPLKSAAILWNCWAECAGGRVGRRELAALRAPPVEIFLCQLPERFSDLFTNEFYGLELAAAREVDDACFLCCLKCGALMSVIGSLVQAMLDHARYCRMVLCMVITGKAATVILTFTFGTNEVRMVPPIYRTEAGDESVGWLLRLPLVLAKSRHSTLLSEVLMGEYSI